MQPSSITNPNHQKILNLIYKFRFLNTSQFQKIFNHKDSHRIKEWLKQLTSKNYIHQNFSRKDFIRNPKPASYCLLPLGRKELKNQKDYDIRVLNRIYKDKTASTKFIGECLFLVDVYLFFLSQNKAGEELTFFTKSNLIKFDYFPTPLPAAYLVLKNPNNKTKRYFLEIFDDQIPWFAIRIRIEQYLEYSENHKWEDHTSGAIPPVLLICPNEKIKKRLIKFISNQITDLVFYITEKNTILFASNKIKVWQKVE